MFQGAEFYETVGWATAFGAIIPYQSSGLSPGYWLLCFLFSSLIMHQGRQHKMDAPPAWTLAPKRGTQK